MAATTPTVNKFQLASLVQHFRQQRGLTQQQLGEQVYPRIEPSKAKHKIANLERRSANVHDSELDRIIEACDVTDPNMVALLKQTHAHTSQRGRWAGYRAVYSEDFRPVVDLEEDASEIRVVGVEGSPDLLMNEAYVRAAFSGSYPDQATQADKMDRAVAARLARCSLLTPDRADGKEPVTYHAVLSESCLRRVTGGRTVMRDWIKHLQKLSMLPNVTIQIIPFTANIEGGNAGLNRFTLLTIPVAGIAGDLVFANTSMAREVRYIDDKQLVADYDRLFLVDLGAALGVQDSRRFLKDVELQYS